MKTDTAAYQDLLYESADGVAVVTLNRPEALNALTQRMRAELADALRRGGREARVIVLTGAGRGFCAGQDFGAGPGAPDLEQVMREEVAPILAALHDSDAPVLAAVNGAAAGAGANIALACDVVVAARSATFLQAATRIGLMPEAGATWALPRQAGLARALGMSLFAEPIPAPQAAEWGLIWEVVDDASLAARTAELAARLARGPTRAYAATRRAMREGLGLDREAAFEQEVRALGALSRTGDYEEGVMAALEKRPAAFGGR